MSGEVVLIEDAVLDYVLSKDGIHPKHKVKMFDYVATIPEDELEVYKAECDKKMIDQEPQILNLFKCVKNS